MTDAARHEPVGDPAVIDALSHHIAAPPPLPPEVATRAGLHILDTCAAMLTGTTMKPGRLALAFARSQGGAAQAQVVGSGLLTNAATAGLANGMLAHADETDDSHQYSLTHPGCAVVPAALAMAEACNRDGAAFLRAVALGYDVCVRTNQAIGLGALRRANRSTYTTSGTLGATAAAAHLAGLSPVQVRAALSLAAQQAGGLGCWPRDQEHVEKALVFAGFPGRDGVQAAAMAAAGFTGVDDVFSGPGGFFQGFAPSSAPGRLVDGLGQRYEILRTNIKRWPVGSPIQAALDALTGLIEAHHLRADAVATLTVRISEGAAAVVGDRPIPEINCQHIMAVTLLDGGLTFAAAHDYARLDDPEVRALRQRIALIADPALNNLDPPRQGIVEITTTDGRRFSHRTVAVRGSAANPMPGEEVEAKAASLLAPLLGAERTGELIRQCRALGELPSVLALRPLLRLDGLAA